MTVTKCRDDKEMLALREYFRAVSHDFNNVHGSILGYADLLKEQIAHLSGEKELLSKYIDMIITATGQAMELNNKVSEFAHTGKFDKDA